VFKKGLVGLRWDTQEKEDAAYLPKLAGGKKWDRQEPEVGLLYKFCIMRFDFCIKWFDSGL